MVNEILTRAAGKPVCPGETAVLTPDCILLNDVISLGGFEDIEKPAAGEKIVVVVDHGVPVPPTTIMGTDVDLPVHENALLHFAERNALHMEYGSTIGYYYMANTVPAGSLILGCGRNISTLGVNGALGLPVSVAEMKELLKRDKVEITVPGTYRVRLTGKLAASASARDAGYCMVSALNTSETCGKVIEFCGDAFDAMSTGEKAQILNLAPDMGAVSAMVVADDGGCDAEFDLSKVVPVVVMAGSMQNVVPVSQLEERIPITTGFIGGCGAGYLEDLRTAASIMKGHKVAYGTRIIVSPIDNDTFKRAMEEGLVDIFLDCDAYFVHPGCLACTGQAGGRLSPEEICFGTGSFNAIGCMGAKNSKVYLASAATVAKGSITGYISKELEG